MSCPEIQCLISEQQHLFQHLSKILTQRITQMRGHCMLSTQLVNYIQHDTKSCNSRIQTIKQTLQNCRACLIDFEKIL